ncbi:hypothetical protein ACFU98_29825 [Streptomyces sp. NPDC057575]|uniref:hypothetical protein n=1 Tax=unclassified Streptomyces TaxID=2593676 RepID=UPI0036A90E6B
MTDENDPRISDLWRGQRTSILQLWAAFRNIGAQYFIRDGRQRAIRIQLNDVNGRLIVLDEALIPESAFDDLRLALQDLYERRVTENEEQGLLAQYRGDRDTRSMQRGGVVSRRDPDEAKAEIRRCYAEAARRASQPDIPLAAWKTEEDRAAREETTPS